MGMGLAQSDAWLPFAFRSAYLPPPHIEVLVQHLDQVPVFLTDRKDGFVKSAYFSIATAG